MNVRLPIFVTAAIVATLCVSTGAPAQQAAPAFAGKSLTAPPTDSWPTNGGDWYNRRYSPLTEITRDNVAELKGVWRARLGGSATGTQYSGEAQPLFYDGVLYVSTGANDVFAIDVETGETLWTYEAELDAGITTVCCGWVNRGVALGDGRIYHGQLNGELLALDQGTGEVLWRIQAERWEDGFTITSAPLYYDGLVVTGFAGGEYGVRGRVKAYDADDGSLVWTFYTIPGPGEVGHDTWPEDNEIWQSGGATVWQTPALDPELGLIYFSTGNPGPDFNGAIRAGDNLFSVSIVAVDAATGEYRWHFQQVHHDLWDYDSPAPVVLFDLEIDGVARKGLAQASKTGWVYILDRTNGEPLIGIEERPVPQEARQATAATQPYPIGDPFVPHAIEIAPEGFELVNGGRIFTPFWTDYVIAKPGIGGGANWPPTSVDAARGLIYVCAADGATVFRAWDIADGEPPLAELYIGGDFGTNPMPRFGVFAALDLRTNKLVWQQHWPDRCLSGSVTTAGGLVFVGRSDGRLTALDAASGAMLWEFQTGAGMNAPASVFEHDGHQYVAAYSAGNVGGGARGDSVWLFSLEGMLAEVPPAGPRLTDTAPGASDAAISLDAGMATYGASCIFCHGPAGSGGHGGPAFGAARTIDEITRIVSAGGNTMPAFGGTLSVSEIASVSAWVHELAARAASDAAAE
jgi:alcohol dehydrogenase (cytochrome c)